ncbi:hypothetical protein PSHT_09126, partial [Puccinia striiformis]
STFNNASQENIRQNDSSCKAPHLLAPGQPPLMTSSINVTDVTPSTNTTGGTQRPEFVHLHNRGKLSQTLIPIAWP